MHFLGGSERATLVKGNEVALEHTTPFSGLLAPKDGSPPLLRLHSGVTSRHQPFCPRQWRMRAALLLRATTRGLRSTRSLASADSHSNVSLPSFRCQLAAQVLDAQRRLVLRCVALGVIQDDRQQIRPLSGAGEIFPRGDAHPDTETRVPKPPPRPIERLAPSETEREQLRGQLCGLMPSPRSSAVGQKPPPQSSTATTRDKTGSVRPTGRRSAAFATAQNASTNLRSSHHPTARHSADC